MTGTFAIPATLNADLADICGMPNFQCALIAHAFRDIDGAIIPSKAEAEQAFVIHWLLGIYSEHGAEWRRVAGQKLQELHGRRPTVSAAAEEG